MYAATAVRISSEYQSTMKPVFNTQPAGTFGIVGAKGILAAKLYHKILPYEILEQYKFDEASSKERWQLPKGASISAESRNPAHIKKKKVFRRGRLGMTQQHLT